MPRDDNEKQKRPPGRPRTRAFYNRISFHLSTELHQEIKEIAKKRGVFLEDIYKEAIIMLININKRGSDCHYSKAPPHLLAKSVTISMERELAQAIRHLAIDARGSLGDIVETAVRLYLQGPL